MPTSRFWHSRRTTRFFSRCLDTSMLSLASRRQRVKSFRSCREMSKDKYVPSLYVAMVYTGLGDMDQAFYWLDKAYAERCEYLGLSAH